MESAPKQGEGYNPAARLLAANSAVSYITDSRIYGQVRNRMGDAVNKVKGVLDRGVELLKNSLQSLYKEKTNPRELDNTVLSLYKNPKTPEEKAEEVFSQSNITRKPAWNDHNKRNLFQNNDTKGVYNYGPYKREYRESEGLEGKKNKTYDQLLATISHYMPDSVNKLLKGMKERYHKEKYEPNFQPASQDLNAGGLELLVA